MRDSTAHPAALNRSLDRFWSRTRPLRSLDEATAYVRCHGDRTETILAVRPIPPTPRPALVARGPGRVSGEQLRRRFEQLLDAREDS